MTGELRDKLFARLESLEKAARTEAALYSPLNGTGDVLRAFADGLRTIINDTRKEEAQ